MDNTPKIYSAIATAMGEIAKEGISKSRENKLQSYKFRGIDDVYNALSPILAKSKIVILPRVLSRDCVERSSSKGGAIFYTVLDVEFDFVCAEDGSKHTVRTAGEAMDSSDKSTNKAMSAAFKYACMQVFCIPTEGDNDSENDTIEVTHGKIVASSSIPRRNHNDDIAQILAITTLDGLSTAFEACKANKNQYSHDGYAAIVDTVKGHRDALMALDKELNMREIANG